LPVLDVNARTRNNPRPNDGTSFEDYADADFCGNWNRATSMNDASTAKSGTGYIISFAGCPITWVSKLQTQIALSITEAEYIALSQSLREVITMINLMTEVNRLVVCNYCTVPKVYCKAFEDGSGALHYTMYLIRFNKLILRSKI
jgi:hypothetical protein